MDIDNSLKHTAANNDHWPKWERVSDFMAFFFSWLGHVDHLES